ncbi:MAG TPA: alpha-ketoglutarate-dependent dioxygenase AlkB [Acidimicrobiia bacterium]|nr:alpha-ketoglutarate-dependent dioxygenase AlkB [Acidimicrobiia bacterium]
MAVVQTPELFPRTRREVAPGAVHVPDWLDLDEQRELVESCRAWAKPPAGLRTPRMPDGTPLSIRSVCLGWHWYPYAYSRTCDDHDGAPVKPMPEHVVALAQRAATATGYGRLRPHFDSAIINVYDAESKLGLHQDDGEGAAMVAGSPVVTISLGDTCIFRLGNSETRTRPWHDIELRSGDLFVFGAASRLAFHGVVRTRPFTAPAELGLRDTRISITVRESGLG